MKHQYKLNPMWQLIAEKFNLKSKKQLKKMQDFEDNHLKMEAEESFGKQSQQKGVKAY